MAGICPSGSAGCHAGVHRRVHDIIPIYKRLVGETVWLDVSTGAFVRIDADRFSVAAFDVEGNKFLEAREPNGRSEAGRR
jgi:hypothetical protein